MILTLTRAQPADSTTLGPSSAEDGARAVEAAGDATVEGVGVGFGARGVAPSRTLAFGLPMFTGQMIQLAHTNNTTHD